MSSRLLVVQLDKRPGGSQNLWLHALTDSSFQAAERQVLLPSGGVTRLSTAELAAAGITVNTFGGGAARMASEVARRLGAGYDPLASAVAARDPDLVWFNLDGLGQIGWIDAAAARCRELGIPYWLIVQHVHENFFFQADVNRELASIVVAGAKRILSVSAGNRAALETALGQELPQLEAAVNGVTRAFLDASASVARTRPPRTTGTARFICPSRFDPYFKGQHLLLAALAGAEWRSRDWHLTLLGDGPHARLMPKLVAHFGLPAERVTIAPQTSDIIGAFAESDVIVMPSLSEGLPFAMVEGMACGRPAVGTPISGIDELVRDGETGWLARSAREADVAEALARCWNDRPRWAERGAAARALIEKNFDLSAVHPGLFERVQRDARQRR
jgi:glycosyltransferase involved in cell wall biosynthesis